MIKKNFVLAISVFALFATGAVHADIASTKYVDEKLPAAGSTSRPVYVNSSGKAVAVSRIAASLLPVAPPYRDVVDHGLEMAPGAVYIAASEDDYNNMSEDYDYLMDALVPNVWYMKDSIRNTFAQDAIWSSPCDDPESEDCVVSAAGVIKGVDIGRGVNNYDSVPAQILDGVIEIPLANDHESSYSPGVVRVANDSDEYDEILETFDLGVVGSTVPTVEYMQSEIATNKLDQAGSTSTPVYIKSDGKAAAVTAIASSLLPLASFARMNLGEDPYVREPGVVTGVDFLTAAELPFSRDGEEDAYGPIIEDGVIGIPFATPDGLNGVPVPGVVWVVDDDDELLDADDQSLNWADSATSEEAGRIVPSVEYMKNEIEENKLIAGDNVTISDLDNSINVATASATTAGVTTWGTIPAGSATSTTSAKIWIE